MAIPSTNLYVKLVLGILPGMDEIIIEEKKYISSKRAAKITGYAKDYIGQLCREGRVPARLVGRGWYVLETAIQDHRFGYKNEPPVPHTSGLNKGGYVVPVSQPVSEFPRYEASSEEAIPLVSRLQHPFGRPDAGNTEREVSQHLQDSWRAWFDHIGTSIEAPEDTTVEREQVVPAVATSQKPQKEEEKSEIKQDRNGAINVPIHAVYKSPPKELLPRIYPETTPQNSPQEGKKVNKGIIKVIKVVGTTFSLLIAIAAIIGTGYFDEYIISNNQVSIISGVSLYNK